MYPSATKLEAEIIAMTADMLHGDDDTSGLVTSGGTESLVTAMLTYREWGRNAKGIDRPQIIMPVTAHPAHEQGVPLLRHRGGQGAGRPTTTWSTSTSCATTSAPTPSRWSARAGTYPHGLIDPIPELGQIALEHGIGLHVDGCLGGFILAWAKDLRLRAARRSTSRVPGRHEHLGRHPQVRLRAEGQLGAAVPAEVAAPRTST